MYTVDRQKAAILSAMFLGDEFVLSDTAVRELGMSKAAVLKAMQRGTLPAHKIGRTWVINRADLDCFKALPRKRGPKPRTA